MLRNALISFAAIAATAALMLAIYAVALKPAPAVGDTAARTYAIQYVRDLATSQGAIVDRVTVLAERAHGNTAIVRERVTFHQPGLARSPQTLTISVTLLRGVWVERYAKLTD